jgi:hypothetical protein
MTATSLKEITFQHSIILEMEIKGSKRSKANLQYHRLFGSWSNQQPITCKPLWLFNRMLYASTGIDRSARGASGHVQYRNLNGQTKFMK